VNHWRSPFVSHLLTVAVLMAFANISALAHAGQASPGSVRSFGRLADGTAVELYSMASDMVEVSITNYGGRIVTLKTPDRDGHWGDVVLGFDTLDGYLAGKPFFGALVGRYANRIADGRFVLDGRPYRLEQNAGHSALHGGRVGFDKRLWHGRLTGNSLELTYLSPDGEEGYPGTLAVKVRYALAANELRIDYRATTDRDTVLNLTNHSYFNLSAGADATVLGHQVTLYADRYTPVNEEQIPTGELRSVAGTPFDFRRSHAVGDRIGDADEQLRIAKGYDQNWVLSRADGRMGLAASVYEPASGRMLEVLTNQPALQFYTANSLDVIGKGGQHYLAHAGFCVETQHYPDSPNQPSFPSTELKAGETFESTTIFRFSAVHRP
jgi:aldose 1-epimerase